MSPLQTDSRSSASTSAETQTQSLREVHERLVSFIAAHATLGKATLSLADSIVEFYSPQDAGFAPAVAFQTVAAEGISGLLCAQLQALVQTALRPLARFTAELSQMNALAKSCRQKAESEHHYAKKVDWLNSKLETERREDKRAVLQEKVELARLVDSSHQSSYDCFNPVFASICQFQEASYSHGHLLSSMLLRVARASLGTTALPMATAATVASAVPTVVPSLLLPENEGERVLKWRDDGISGGAGAAVYGGGGGGGSG
ncbi:unnamed protein product, partial [Pylaiella littoralis]